MGFARDAGGYPAIDMKKTTLVFPVLLLPGILLAQTAAPAAPAAPTVSSTVVYSQPSSADAFLAANAGASLAKAASGKLTFKKADGSYRLVSGKSLTYQQNGQWVPTKLQVAALSDGSGWTLNGVGINAKFAKTDHADKDLSVTSGLVVFNIRAPQLTYNNDDTFNFDSSEEIVGRRRLG